MEKRSAALRSGSMFFGDLAAVNLKVDHFSFVSAFQHSHTIPSKGVLILSAVLLRSFWQSRVGYGAAGEVQKENPSFQIF